MTGLDVPQTIIFVLSNLVMLMVLVGARPQLARRISPRRLIVGASLPVLTLCMFFMLGDTSGHDRSLTLKIDTFQVPYERMKRGVADDEGRFVYFIAGETPEHSDLVVPPYADTLRAAEYARDGARPIFEIVGGNASMRERNGDAPPVWLCRYDYPPLEQLELPGWTVSFAIDGKPLQGGTARARDCSYRLDPGGDPVHVTLNRVERFDGKDSLTDRRSFTVSHSGQGVQVKLDTPISSQLATCKPAAFRLLPGLPLGETMDFLPQENGLRPAQIGSGGANPIIEPRFIGNTITDKSVCGGTNSGYYWPTVKQDDWHVAGTIVSHFIPWFLAILFAVNSVVIYVLRSKAWETARAEFCIVLTLQWMLMLRALIGVSGLFSDPSLSRSEVLFDAGMAYVCLPAAAVLLLMRGTIPSVRLASVLAGVVLASLVALVISQGSIEGIAVPLALTGIVLALAYLRAKSKSQTSLLERAISWIVSRQKSRDLFAVGQRIIWLAFFSRLALMAVGWLLSIVWKGAPSLTERVWFLSLSTIYQPLLIVGFALTLVALVREPTIRKAAGIVVMWLATGMALPALLGDFGIIWIFSWPIAFVMSWIAIRALLAKRAAIAVPFSLLALSPLAIIALAFYWASEPIPQPNEGLPGDHLQASVDWNKRDYVRLLRYAAPERLELLGNQRSIEMLDHAASLEPLVQEFWGRGYLDPSLIRGKILDYQYNDNLLAIHVMWPFGRFGVVALLAFIISSAAVLTPRMRPSEVTVGAAISFMAAATIAWAAIYMTLANLNLAPFTGRNAFLLAATSGSDAIEGLVMILLASCSWFWVSQSEGAQR